MSERIPEGWKKVKLGDLVDIKHGFAFKGEFMQTEPNENILITPGNFKIGGGWKGDKCKYYNGEIPEEYVLKPGDLIVTMTDLSKTADTLGYSAIVPDDSMHKYLHNQRIGLVMLKSSYADKMFLNWLMRAPEYRHHVVSSASGSTVYHTSPSRIKEFLFFLPPLPEQKAIASVLSSLDDKIDLLHRENKTLEQMAETLFRQWFIEEKEEGWEECILADLCDRIGSGGTPSTKVEEYYGGDINWYSTKELNDGFLFESEKKITLEGLENSAAKLFPKGTVVIAIYAAPTVGRLGILANKSSFNQAACGLVADTEICSKEFLYLYLKTERGNLNAMASGSAQQNLNVKKIKTYPAFKPTKEIMEKFNGYIQPIFDKIENNSVQIRTLENLRDTLLPKLMSGEVRVGYGGSS